MIVKKRCNHAGCRALIERTESYCSDHRHITHQSYNQYRNEMHPEYIKFYKSTAWRNLRKRIMREQQYLCQDCLDKDIYQVGEEVHHIHSTRTEAGWAKRLDPRYLRLLCRPCHQVHSKREKREREQ